MRKEAKLIGKVANGLDRTSAQSPKMLFLRQKNAPPGKAYPKAQAPRQEAKERGAKISVLPAMQVRKLGIQERIFNSVKYAAEVVVITFYLALSAFGLGSLLPSAANAQDNSKPKTGQNVTQKKMTWGDVKAKFKAPEEKAGDEKKAGGKTWIEKGEKKYDVSYDSQNGTVIFKKFDGEHSISFSLFDVDLSSIRQLAATPLKELQHFKLSPYGDGILLVYQDGSVFLKPFIDINNKPAIRCIVKAINISQVSN